MPHDILVSAGEVSSDRYAALLVDELRRAWPDARFFGCAGSRMRRAGVEPVIEAESLAVVGLVEVVSHLPRIYRQYRKLAAECKSRNVTLVAVSKTEPVHDILALYELGQRDFS